ncbi:UNVERIFIED_CONTAM: hypothetical protein GTU68_049505 [Idotea baltica]|nr:hypothetical protein [Idotea baltica]
MSLKRFCVSFMVWANTQLVMRIWRNFLTKVVFLAILSIMLGMANLTENVDIPTVTTNC